MDGDEPLTESEKESLREWIGRSPAHREELIRVTNFWDQGKRPIGTALTTGLGLRDLRSVAKGQSRSRSRE